MSDIHGSGFGSKHNWHRHFTRANKSTPYTCDCGASFTHWYDETPNIFQAIKEAGVPEDCASKLVEQNGHIAQQPHTAIVKRCTSCQRVIDGTCEGAKCHSESNFSQRQ